jgi:hypothetical protein
MGARGRDCVVSGGVVTEVPREAIEAGEFLRGDRVQLNAEGFRRLGERPLEGVVVGFSRDGACARVVWDGQVSPLAYHLSFLEPV